MGKPPSKLKRKAETRLLPPRHVVFCEGKTEEYFLEGIRRFRRLSNATIRVVGQAGDPMKIVNAALDELAPFRRGRRVRAGSEAPVVHVVFDRDEHHHFDAACRKAREHALGLGISNPCFEIWLYWLKADHTAPLQRQDAQRLCRKVHKGYHHERSPIVEFTGCHNELDDARRRSKAMEAAHVRDQAADRFPNPSSTFSDVVDALLAVTVPAPR